MWNQVSFIHVHTCITIIVCVQKWLYNIHLSMNDDFLFTDYSVRYCDTPSYLVFIIVCHTNTFSLYLPLFRFKNNMPIQSDIRHTVMVHSDGNTTLEVKDAVRRFDSAVYRCEAISFLGIATTESKITVLGRSGMAAFHYTHTLYK